MVLRRRLLLSFLLMPLTCSQDTPGFDCRVTLEDGRKYDLTSLAGEHKAQRIRNTPPTSMEDELLFNLCAPLRHPLEGVAEEDQCPEGTRACLTTTNKKSDHTDRIVAVIPIAKTDLIHPEYTPLSSPEGLTLVLQGPPYPTPDSKAQALNLTLFCHDTQSEPQFTSYNGIQLRIEWQAPAGCATSGDGSPNDDDKTGDGDSDDRKEKSVGSGIGWFFLLLLLAFAAYFALGAYYNYSTYGATGTDLIPHRDFWMDVPYLVRDVVSHLCSTVRPRHSSSRGGYIAV